MKQWRKAAFSINIDRAIAKAINHNETPDRHVPVPATARTQMRQRLHFANLTAKLPKVTRLLQGLLYKAGMLPARADGAQP